MGETEAGFQVLSFILSLMIWAHWEKLATLEKTQFCLEG